MTASNDAQDATNTYHCQHCGSEIDSAYRWEMHILTECPEAPKNHKEWINGGPLD